jgi:hypothetical protein
MVKCLNKSPMSRPCHLSNPSLLGVNLRLPAKACFNCFQPEGLTDSSRWSRGKRGATTGIRRAGRLHPGRGARTVVPVPDDVCFWHPFGVHHGKATASGGRSPFAPERPPATICQPFGLQQAPVFAQVLRSTPTRWSRVLMRESGPGPPVPSGPVTFTHESFSHAYRTQSP